MIGRLSGEVIAVGTPSVLIDVQGVGYEVACPLPVRERLRVGESAVLVVHTVMRETELSLYGFSTALEKRLFEFLLQVNGVGPKSALEVLSAFDAVELIRVLGSGEVAKIQRAKGIGKKTADRIVLELKDKVSRYALETSSLHEQIEVTRAPDVSEDSVLALVSLGFSKAEAESAVSKALSDDHDLKDGKQHEAGEVVKAALAYL